MKHKGGAEAQAQAPLPPSSTYLIDIPFAQAISCEIIPPCPIKPKSGAAVKALFHFILYLPVIVIGLASGFNLPAEV